MPTRREIRFESLDDAIVDAERLLAGYEKTGNWSLAQVCGHLTAWLTYPLDGFPKPPLMLRPIFAIVRGTMGAKLLNKALANGFKPGSPTMPQSVVPPGGDDRDAVAKFRVAVERFIAHTGPIVPSPLYGEMTKQQALALQCVHAAHHLSLLVPK